MNAATDAHLVRSIGSRRGERAIRDLHRRYAAELYGFARVRLGEPELAEELVQDVFVRVWRNADGFDPERASVRTWLYAIARNALIDLERRRAARPGPALADPSETSDPAEPVEQALLRWQIEVALGQLTVDHREAVTLAHVRGLSVSEIAGRTGLAPGTVKSRIHYGLLHLRTALEELGVVP